MKKIDPRKSIAAVVVPLLVALCILLVIFVLFCIRNQKSTDLSPFKNVNDIEGIWISVKEETLSPTGLEIRFQNTLNRDDLIYGSTYYLERYTQGQWCEVDPLPGAFIGGPDIDYQLSDHTEMQYSWADTYGELSQGRYRIIVELYSKLDRPITEQTSRYYLAAEFHIK